MQRELTGFTYSASEEEQSDNGQMTYLKSEDLCVEGCYFRYMGEDLIEPENIYAFRDGTVEYPENVGK